MHLSYVRYTNMEKRFTQKRVKRIKISDTFLTSANLNNEIHISLYIHNITRNLMFTQAKLLNYFSTGPLYLIELDFW